MPSESPAVESPSTNATLAPRWHTFALVALILMVALAGTLLTYASRGASGTAVPPGAPGSRIWLQYLPLLLVNAGLVVYTTQLFRGRNALPELLGVGWRSPRRAFADVVCAGASVCAIWLLEFFSARLFEAGQSAAIARVVPSTEAERLTWLFVAPCVAFAEEVVYRGYLQTQLAAFARSRALGVVLSAALFGVAHLEQGPRVAMRVALYGLLFGVLALARRSLWPGIMGHALLDLSVGLLR